MLRNLGPGQKAAVYLGAGLTGLLLLCCGAAAVGALGESPPQAAPERAAPATSAAPSPTAAPTTAVAPVVEIRTVTETEAIPHGTRTVKDSSLAKGKEKVRAKGADGVKTLTYEVTYTDGVETARKLLSEKVTTKPVTRVVAVGTKAAAQPRCHPSYKRACVPFASDVDCAGGSGDGPRYVRGPVTVVGNDEYDLDRDGDGIACDT